MSLVVADLGDDRLADPLQTALVGCGCGQVWWSSSSLIPAMLVGHQQEPLDVTLAVKPAP